MKVFFAAVCLLAVVSGTEVERKKKRSAASWPEESWQINEKDGSIKVTLKKGEDKTQPTNEWYAATNSAKHGIKSWANLEADGKHYLVGSKEEKTGAALPTKEDKLVVFKVESSSADLERTDSMSVTLKPMTPASGMSLERRKKRADVFLWGAYWGAWAYAWTWPVWAAAAVAATTGEGQSLEKAYHGKHKTLNKLLHNLEQDVHALAHKGHKSLEKTIEPGCVAWGIWPFGAWWCGIVYKP